MTGFTGVKALVDAELDGKARFAGWRKSPVQPTTIGIWFDMSMSPGNPVPQYYASSPLEAKVLSRTNDIGLDHGQDVTTSKHLREVMALSNSATPLPMAMMLCDYLMYYPFVDQGTTDLQLMEQTATLTRYTDGVGVQIMAVGVAAGLGGQTFQVGYTNSDGVAGRFTDTITLNAAAFVGAIATSDRAVAGARGPFLSLQSGDSGVRSIDSFQMISGPDVGLVTLVLVKPLAQMQIRGLDAPVEVDYMRDFSQAPTIENDAYLNWLCCPSGSLNGVTIYGTIKTVWS